MMTIDFKRLGINTGDRILDLGCGEGRHCINAYILHDKVEVVGVDLSANDLKTAQQRFQDFEEPENTHKQFTLFCANGLSLPFADKSFDKIICSEVLEHIPDYQGMLAEINRLLKDDGLLAISVPRTWPEKICWQLSEAYHRVKGGHIRIFNASALHREVEGFGFSRYARHWAHALHSPYWWLKCLFWDRGDEHFMVKAYHRLLVWDLMEKPWITQSLERLLNPVMGKSVVMYFKRDSSL